MTHAADMIPALHLALEDGIAIVTLDRADESVNVLSQSVKDEFAALFDSIEKNVGLQGVVLISGKKDSFIAGADIEEFLAWTSSADAEAASRAGHELLDRVEKLRVPVVAAIHGACLGGGLEVALACSWRIATDHPKTVLALPEIQLGLIPGAGGTQRLPHTIGVQAALDMILTGKNIRAKKAAQIGLVHEIVHPSILRRVAVQRAREIASGDRPRNPQARRRDAKAILLDDNPIGRSVVIRQARELTTRKTRGNYPAAFAAIDAVSGAFGDRDRGFREESRLFGEMAMTSVARELIFLFFATTALKKDSGVAHPAVEPFRINKLGVLGAGFMGAGIASIAAQAGMVVRLKDADLERVGKGLAAIRTVLKDRLTRKQITRQQFDDQMLLVGGTVDYSGFGDVDLVIEAVFEDLAVKQSVLRDIETVARERTIFASNTSTIPIAHIAEASARPDRVVGMHFFSPVHKMPLLEVIVTPKTANEVTATAVSYGKSLGKTVIVVQDAPGFYVNRILAPYLNEAGRLIDGGAAIDAVDNAMVSFGFPVGPITLLDEVGLDIAGKSGAIFVEAFGERLAPSQTLRRVVESGRLGRKGKKGFYLYDAEGKKGDVDDSIYTLIQGGAGASQRVEFDVEEIQKRCVLAMVNEAARAFEEGIVRSPRDGDVGAVFGIGFPPFRGGPFRYIDSMGAGRVVDELEELNTRFLGRYFPAEILVRMARRGDRFYPASGRPL